MEKGKTMSDCRKCASFEECLNEDCGLFVEKKPTMIKFILNGCDIQFIAEAPADITLEQLLRQCDKIKPHWCACGIKSYDFDFDFLAELRIDYDSIIKLDPAVSCDIEGEEEENV